MHKRDTYVLAVDFGASGGRAILGHLDGGRILMEEILRFSNDPVMTDGAMYWDTQQQLEHIKQSIVRANDLAPVESLGIDTWGVDFGLIGADGQLLENAVHYRDDRTLGMPEKVFERIPKEDLYMETGVQIENFNTIYQLYSLVEKCPQMLEKTETLLLTPDLFNYFLTGKKRAEYTMASTTQLMNAETGEWSEMTMNRLNIPERIFPEFIMPGTLLGTLTDSICEELHVPPIKVVSVASHDTESAVASIPAHKDDFLFISCGTWSICGAELAGPMINRETLDCNISNEIGYGRRAVFLKNIIGLWLIQESRRQWMREGHTYSFSELETLAREAGEFDGFINPDAPEFVSPGNIPQRICNFCRKTGQSVPKSIGEIVRCIYQSLALKYRYAFEQIETCAEKNYSTIYMIGGGIQSRMLLEMTSKATGKRVVAGPVEATALGNIAVQLIALGHIRDLKEAREILSKSVEICVELPGDCEKWNKAYEKFKHIIE